ncbi:MAG: beta-galactosidase [Verrucomicrobiota bacterium]
MTAAAARVYSVGMRNLADTPRAWRWFPGPLFFLFCLAAVCAQDTDRLRSWDDYHTIMWVGDTAYRQPGKLPLFFQRLREMGVNTAMVYGEGEAQPLLENRFPYYVENMINRGLCLKFNSNVRDWDKFVTGWAQSGRPEAGLARDYCLDDPQWLEWARQQMQKLVRKHRGHEPLAYNIRDELSTTISANPFDYDYNPIALAKFREWLRTQYPSPAALNAQWQTRFDSWEEVKPFTTDQIKNRMASGEALPRGRPDWQQVQALKFDPAAARQAPTAWNFAPWADFRTYMDLSLARALDQLRQAARELDPRTPVGIEGTQMPDAFGGYDLWRLSQALDWVEPYDVGNAREIFGSFMPARPLLTTVFESDTAHARRRLWHLLLEGDRGCIVWWSEDCIDWKNPDYPLTAKAKALAPALNEMTSPLARLFLRARRERDPILVHYSQPSVQVDWLLESTVDGSTWLRRFSSFEAEHNRQAVVRDSWLKAFQDAGYSPQFISSEQIEKGLLRKPGNAVLVFPSSWALSDKEAVEIGAFLQNSPAQAAWRAAFCDGTPGLFDAHGTLRRRSPLEALFPLAPAGSARCIAPQSGGGETPAPADIARYALERLKTGPVPAWPDWLGIRLSAMPPEIRLPAAARTRIHRFSVRRGRLTAFERNIDYHTSEELKPAGGNEALEKPVELEAALAQPAHVYDLRAQKYLGRTDRIRFQLDPWQPALFALTEEKLPPESIVASLSAD